MLSLRNGTKKINLSPLCSLYALCLAPVIASAYTYQDMCRIISITQSYAIRVWKQEVSDAKNETSIFSLILVFASSVWGVDFNCPGGQWVLISSPPSCGYYQNVTACEIIEGGTKTIYAQSKRCWYNPPNSLCSDASPGCIQGNVCGVGPPARVKVSGLETWQMNLICIKFLHGKTSADRISRRLVSYSKPWEWEKEDIPWWRRQDKIPWNPPRLSCPLCNPDSQLCADG